MIDHILKTEDLAAGYRGKSVLSNVDLMIKRGEVVSLMGQNGSGKTTLLKTLSGHIKQLSGKIFIEDKEIEKYDEKALSMIRAELFTRSKEINGLSCYEVVSLGRYPYMGHFFKIKEEDHKEILDALKKTGSIEFIDRRYEDLSDGQKQRILLSRAICQKPRLLFLDEPASFLDIKYKIEIMEEIKRLSRDYSITCILSVHDIDLIERFSDVCICLKDNKVSGILSPYEAVKEENISFLFDLKDNSLSLKNDDPFFGEGLREGITTGSCAAAAAAAATDFLLNGVFSDKISLSLPTGRRIDVKIIDTGFIDKDKNISFSSVIKDSGDDPDVTDKIKIRADAEIIYDTDFPERVYITGGEGIGIVRKPGLDQKIGEYAINSVPRKMIKKSVLSVLDKSSFEGKIKITINAIGGEEIAKKTFNEELGIEGGISILGTTGIVEPMSDKALLDSIKLRIRQRFFEGKRSIILTPGNYGENFIKENEHELLIDRSDAIKCSNFIGDSIKYALKCGFKDIVLVSHIGKAVKLAANMMNTHSKYGDTRREVFTAHAAINGASKEEIELLFNSNTTEESISVLKKYDDNKTLKSICDKIMENLLKYLKDDEIDSLRIIIYSMEEKVLSDDTFYRSGSGRP